MYSSICLLEFTRHFHTLSYIYNHARARVHAHTRARMHTRFISLLLIGVCVFEQKYAYVHRYTKASYTINVGDGINYACIDREME